MAIAQENIRIANEKMIQSRQNYVANRLADDEIIKQKVEPTRHFLR
tara:strand:- start:135 stop:272 length:138 start_codon:yes stop_codon:yes gene_type:complete